MASGTENSGGQSPWQVGRVDLRSSVAAHAWPTARLELEHPERGRVTDIGSAPGAFDAAFVAASHILGVNPTLLSYNVRSHQRDSEGALTITIDIAIEHEGKTFSGSNTGQDLVECSLHAWLDAVHQATGAQD